MAAEKMTTSMTPTSVTPGLGWKRQAIGVCVSLLAALYSLPVFATSPTEWHRLLPGSQLVGQGEFRYWGFLIYEASLWSPTGNYRRGEPFALRLRYERDIERDDIVQASIDQMQGLGLPTLQHPEWRLRLAQVIPSVRSGDTLTGVYLPGEGATFFHNGESTGTIDDALAKAFFSIWLDPATSEPDLRQALVGGGQR